MNNRCKLGYLIPLIALSLLLSGLLSCSADRSGSPTSPTITHQESINPGSASRVLWGMWHVSIDPVTMTAEVAPLRTADFTANVTKFMQPPVSPGNMVSIVIDPLSVPSTGHFIVDVQLKHPFQGLNQYNGFDVRGILFSNGSIPGMHDATVLRSGPADTTLLNADGYTRWWNWPEFTTTETIFGATQGKLAPPNHPTSTVNGYKYFAQGLGLKDPVTALDPSSRGFFPTLPGVFSREYDIQFKMNAGAPVLDFNYAVDASWETPDPSFAPDYPQAAFPLSANCQEAFNVSVSDAGSTAFYVDPSTKGGNFHLKVEVFDWQGGAKGNVPGEISGLFMEGDVLGAADDILASATILPGSTVNSSVYDVSITPTNLTGAGSFQLFGTVESASPATYEPQITGGSSFHFPSAHLAAYFVTSVTVSGANPGPPPTVTNINPNTGIPDCTPEHVTITGTNFVSGATFRLEKSGQPSIDATNVEFINATTLEGDLLLTDAVTGAWDVVVQNPDGQTGKLVAGFTVLKVLYVDGDNSGDSGMNGTAAHPYDTIQKGIDAAATSANEPVIVDQCTIPYAVFALKNSSHVIGCNWNNGVGWPTVKQTNSATYANNVTNATVEGLFFDMTLNSGSPNSGAYINGGSGILFKGCKFSAIITCPSAYVMRVNNTTNIEVSYSEFVNVYHRGDPGGDRWFMVLAGEGVNGYKINHTEFHHIGFDQPDSGANYSEVIVVRAGYGTNGPHNIDFHNVLVYDIFDKTNAIGDRQNYMGAFELSNVNSFDWVGDFKFYNITVDDLRHADTPSSTNVQSGHVHAGYFAMVGGTRVWKNNIASNIIPTDESMVAGNSSYFGWWVDNYVVPPPSPQPMDYSDCFNLGKPLPPGANSWQWTSGYINQCEAGVGSYQNFEDMDPQYSKTPGATFYHPTNPLVSQGADDGSEMGAFGGPEGDWLPLSQQ